MSKPIDLLRRELHAFCALAQRRGYRIGYAGNNICRGDIVCPIGAMGVAVFGKPETGAVGDAPGAYDVARAVFGTTIIEPFYIGFDNSSDGPHWDGHPLKELGLEFRRHYCGETP
jgi:hypothetical protein